MTIGINNGLSSTIADSLVYDNEFPIAGEDNPSLPFRDNYKILQVGIENLQSKRLVISGDGEGTSEIFDSGSGDISLVLSLTSNFLPISGGTLTGVLTLDADPTTDFEAATKKYVDDVFDAVDTVAGLDAKVDKAGDTMSGDLDMDSNQIKGVADPTDLGDAVNKLYADTRYINRSGDTMLGDLTLQGDPTISLHAATKDYVDTGLSGKSDTGHDHDAAYVNVTGDTMSGSLTIDGEGAVLNVNTINALGIPADIDMNLVPKGTGLILAPFGYDMSSGPVQALATKGYVDTGLSGKSDTAHNHDATYVNVTGDTMSGSLTIDGEGAELNVNTINALGVSADIDMNLVPKGTGLVLAPFGYDMSSGPDRALATKDYVDDEITSHDHDADYVNVTGDTMSGSLTIDGEGAVLNVSIINAVGVPADIDMELVPKGTGLVVSPSGYDMSAGPDAAFTTKGYVDIVSSLTKNFAEAGDVIVINSKHQLIVYGEYIIEPGGSLLIEENAALVIL